MTFFSLSSVAFHLADARSVAKHEREQVSRGEINER